MIIHKEAVTGLVLAGGRATRMGGVDKGLQTHLGVPLAQYALERLRPQVGTLMLNANRKPGRLPRHGRAGLARRDTRVSRASGGHARRPHHCSTPYLVTVPCDTPNFPVDLVARLAAGLEIDGEMATAYSQEPDGPRAQPVFCLMKASLREQLETPLSAAEERKTGLFAAQHHSTRSYSMILPPSPTANTPRRTRRLTNQSEALSRLENLAAAETDLGRRRTAERSGAPRNT